MAEKSRSDFDPLRQGLYVGRPDDPTVGVISENALERGEDTPRPDMYQLYRAADWTSSPAPVIAQGGAPEPQTDHAPDGVGELGSACSRGHAFRARPSRRGVGAEETS